MAALAIAASALAACGAGIALLGAALVRRFAARPPAEPRALPPVSVLKPLYGDEALLEEALASVCAQDYPSFQVVFGVQDPADPALRTVRRLQARFPGCDIAMVVDDSHAGANRKVANLANMLPFARHDVLVIADSDVHAAPDYLRRVVAALAAPGVGLVTTLYTGLPLGDALAARLGAAAITHIFLPGALLARACGRQDALGATMALRRDALEAVGGFAALRDALADDNLLGRRVRALGLAVALAGTIPATTVAETRLAALFRHELRWGRTIRALAPLSYAASVLQYPLAWALLALLLARGAPWSVAVLALSWAARAIAARRIDRVLGLRGRAAAPLWHLPLRDLMSVAVLIASFMGDRVEWRGQTLRAAPPPRPAASLGIERA